MADFMRDRAGEDQLGSDGVSGSDAGVVSAGGLLQKSGNTFCVRRNIDCDALGAC